MRTEEENALLAMELCDVAVGLFERFQSYAPKNYRWGTKMIAACTEQMQTQLRRLDAAKERTNP